MKQTYFIKHDQRIRRIIGCDRATLIFDRLEFYSSRQPDGFYKFIEPNSHRLYRKDDSWTELLDCHRTSFWRAFKLIGKKHTSRWTFEESEDKFGGKLYASYYDRNTNRMFFVRNHDAVKEFFAKIQPGLELGDKTKKYQTNRQHCSGYGYPKNSLRTEQNAHSYNEPKSSSLDLSLDKSHAEEVIKKMIELWTALVEDGGGKIELTRKRIAFLKQAFKDKFDSCLEKWKKYCQDIASSRFLMGEIKSSFRATLDWALKFDVIQKILEGNYGIGDRSPSTVSSATESFVKNSKIEMASEEAVIEKAPDEPELVRKFRLKWLNKFGISNYRECLKDCAIEVGDDATLILRPSSRYNAKSIASYWTPTLLVASPFTKVHVVQQEGDLVFDKWFLLEPSREETLPEHDGFEVNIFSDLTAAPMAMPLLEATDVVEAVIEKSSENPRACEDQEPGSAVVEVTSETQMLQNKLRQALPPNHFPSWLSTIEVEGISQDGKIVVTFEDFFAVGWSRSRFSKEIFQSVASLWKGVNKLIIRQKEGDRPPLSIEKIQKNQRMSRRNRR